MTVGYDTKIGRTPVTATVAWKNFTVKMVLLPAVPAVCRPG